MSGSDVDKHEHLRNPEYFSGSSSDDEDDEDLRLFGNSDEIDGYLANRILGLDMNQPLPEQLLDEVSFSGIIRYITSGKAQRIITMVGAGISTSAGIPDFRTPDSGLYSRIAQEYPDVGDPTDLFSMNYFRANPKPFFQLAKDLLKTQNYIPTPCHYFIKLLESKGLLLRHYTQNIDTLERKAGVSQELLVEAHGSFASSTCLHCGWRYDQAWMEKKVNEMEIVFCEVEGCGGVVKPDIVFFGESLPDRFSRLVFQDFTSCDLLIIMGTSLQVQPFASLVNRVRDTTPRLLINMEVVGDGGVNNFILRYMGMGGMDFSSDRRYRDVAEIGKCDDGCKKLAEALGWKEELISLMGGS
uniref:NAD-dependent protein deacetylase n=1 Tax=Caligus clemensi TaxID=344056 RepID=C1C279_CALCM|nr:NAD-dependent deacetylase sirtuin-2 [Caligus clemensi]